jgi:hypothetical protein
MLTACSAAGQPDDSTDGGTAKLESRAAAASCRRSVSRPIASPTPTAPRWRRILAALTRAARRRRVEAGLGYLSDSCQGDIRQ